MDGNLCSRCGKQRIVTKTWQKKVANSWVTYTITSCPDADCQKLVDSGLKTQQQKRDQIRIEKERRIAFLQQSGTS